MRILVVHNYYQHKGGEDVVFQQEVEALKKVHTVETITYQNQKGLKGLKQFASYPWNATAANQIVQKAKDFEADIVHFHNTHYAIGPLAFRKLHQAGFKTVQTLHNYRLLDPSATLFVNGEIFLDTLEEKFPWKSIKLKTLDNSLLKTFWVAFAYYIHHKLGTWKQINRFLVFSNFMKGLMLKSSKNLQESQIAIKVNAIEHPAIPSFARSSNFVYIGRLSIEKGIQTLLEAFKNSPQYVLEIYGDGPIAEEVMEVASSYSNIQYKCFQQKETLNKALATSQALIVPSIWFEGMPMTVLEAYALGTPVISSKIGALEEMIIDEETGLHFTAGNAESLAHTIDKFASLPQEIKQKWNDNCLTEYRSKYQLAENIKSLVAIYKEILQDK